jgi:very-short-patch-repair endonuclease
MDNKDRPNPWYSPIERWILLKPLARDMRRDMVLSERILWKYIRNRQILGYKFRRQQVIGNYIVDFYCHELKLVLEVDGLSHEGKQQYDRERQNFIENLGFKVIRFTNEDVGMNISGVIDELTFQINQINLNND